MTAFDPNSGFFRTSELKYDQVVLTTANDPARVMLGGSVSGLNGGVTTASQGLLVPNPVPTTLPQITATVYLKGVALNPQPSVFWELSCSKLVATIDQNGVTSSLSQLYLRVAIHSELSFSYETFTYALSTLLEIGRVASKEGMYKLRSAEEVDARKAAHTALERLGLA
jgi:hypothetical protein